MKHEELRAKAMQKNGVKAEYEALELEFHLLREMLKTRQEAGLTQTEIAEKMGTIPLIITEMESSLSSGNDKYSPRRLIVIWKLALFITSI